MGEHITVPCLRCGDEIAFEVEPWASEPERAFCDTSCYRAHGGISTVQAAAATR